MSAQEGKTGIITLSDDDPDTVERMLSYLYCSDYESGEDSSSGFNNARVYAIAEKYDIPLLKELAKERFVKWAEDNWSHRDFPAVAREVYESTLSSDRGLRDVVSRLYVEHGKDLVGTAGFVNLGDLIGELGLDVLAKVLRNMDEMEAANVGLTRAL